MKAIRTDAGYAEMGRRFVFVEFRRVLFAACACGFLIGCEKGVTHVEFDAVKKEAAGLKASMEELSMRSAAELEDLEEQLDEQSSERNRLEGDVEVLKQQLEDSEKDLEMLKSEYDDYQRKYRVSVRENAKGRKFEKLVVMGEKEEVFTSVVVQELNPARIRVMHESGVEAIPLVNLSPELQAELGFDLEEAEVFLAAEEVAAKPKVLTQEDKNQKLRDQFAKSRMKDQAKWKKAYGEAQQVKKQMAVVGARQRAVAAALNRSKSSRRGMSGTHSLNQERARLAKQYEALRIKYNRIMNP